jgi:thiamine biosynthesis lipoprotein
MKQTRLMMGMPISIEIVDAEVTEKAITQIYDFFSSVDERFSTYKPTSEISQINAGLLKESEYSQDMQEIFLLAEDTKKKTHGFFNIENNANIDPSGIVKGWAIDQAARLLRQHGFMNFYVDAGGDVQTHGKNVEGENWRIGIRNPFNRDENVKIVAGVDIAVATSGTAIRGQHIYNPLHPERPITEIVSLSIVGNNILDADRFATGAFAMGKSGISFIEELVGFEGYMIDKDGIATYTSGFEKYTE